MCHSVTNTLSSRHHHPPTCRWRTLRECCEGLGDVWFDFIGLNSTAQAPSHGAVVDANDRNSKQLPQPCKRKGHVSQPSIHSATRAAHRKVRVLSRITACFQGPGWSHKSTEIRAGTARRMAGRRARPREETRCGKAMVMGDDNVHYAWARILFIPCGSERGESRYIIIARAIVLTCIGLGVPAFGLYVTVITPVNTVVSTILISNPSVKEDLPGNATIIFAPDDYHYESTAWEVSVTAMKWDQSSIDCPVDGPNILSTAIYSLQRKRLTACIQHEFDHGNPPQWLVTVFWIRNSPVVTVDLQVETAEAHAPQNRWIGSRWMAAQGSGSEQIKANETIGPDLDDVIHGWTWMDVT
ncbi:hypothetical protein B0H13DRAFT_1854758 [Mycena leptocephala]|nr:hypothetical protein B0H13DRAFT_1854758 [Mycena leptocephala]